MIVLGIETSCDETSVGIVEIDSAQNCRLLANVVATSLDLHKVYGGVVPEIAARSHIESMTAVVEEALKQAFDLRVKDDGSLRTQNSKPITSRIQDPNSQIYHDAWNNIDAIAVTYGAGLGGSLLVGVMTARTLAIAKNKPLYAVNHVMGHVYANFITEIGHLRTKNSKLRTAHLGGKEYALPSSAPQFPMLAVIVSGGHSQLALFKGHFDYELLGKTRDDAIGEAYDKVAKITGLPYPGGPSVDMAAKNGDPYRYQLPKPKLGSIRDLGPQSSELRTAKLQDPSSNYDFSFSGLKTAVLRLAQAEIGEDFTFPSFKIAERLTEQQRNDIAASFQRVSIEIIVDKVVQAYQEFKPKSVVLAGGVAASPLLRSTLEERLMDLRSQNTDLGTAKLQDPSSEILQYPDMKLCTDNGAMIATLGCFMALLGQPAADPYSLEIAPNLKM